VKFLKSKQFQSLFGLALSLALILYFVWKIDWTEVGAQLLRVHFIFFVPCTVAVAIHMCLRAQRWRYFLPQGDAARGKDLFDSLMLGALATFILPGRAGEVVRPFVLSKKSGVPFPVGFASVVIERFFDLSAVLISFGLVVTLVPTMRSEVYEGAKMLSVLALLILVGILFGAFAPEFIRKVSGVCVRLFPKFIQDLLLRFVDQLLEGTAVLKHKRKLILATFFTVLVWGSNYLLYYLYTFLVDVEPSMLLGFTVAVVLALAVALPSTPGFIGVYQAGCVVGFQLLGHPWSVAMTFAIVTHIFQYAVFVFYGGYVMLRDNLNLKDLSPGSETPA
jgi:glycosyltransferase 2 family protein